MAKLTRTHRLAADVISRELQSKGGVDASSAISLAEHLIATLDREDLQIVRRPDDVRDALELTRKKRPKKSGAWRDDPETHALARPCHSCGLVVPQLWLRLGSPLGPLDGAASPERPPRPGADSAWAQGPADHSATRGFPRADRARGIGQISPRTVPSPTYRPAAIRPSQTRSDTPCWLKALRRVERTRATRQAED